MLRVALVVRSCCPALSGTACRTRFFAILYVRIIAIKPDAQSDSRGNQYARYFWPHVLIFNSGEPAAAKFGNSFIGQNEANETIDI
jgi:hypothetical protein